MFHPDFVSFQGSMILILQLILNSVLICQLNFLQMSFHHDHYIYYTDFGYVSFSFISGVSGTSLFNSVSLMAYNVFYTSVPVLASVLDKDLSEETIMQHPQILFYCQAGRFDLKLHCHCPVYSLRARLSFHMDCSGSHYIFSVMLYLLLVM